MPLDTEDETASCIFNSLDDADFGWSSLRRRRSAERGFSNRDIRQQLALTPHLRQCANPKKAGAKVSRIFRRLRAHGLIAKIPRSRRWRVTRYGRRVMGAAHTCATTTSRANIPRWSHNLKSRQSSSQNAKKSQWKDLHSRTPRAFRG